MIQLVPPQDPAESKKKTVAAVWPLAAKLIASAAVGIGILYVRSVQQERDRAQANLARAITRAATANIRQDQMMGAMATRLDDLAGTVIDMQAARYKASLPYLPLADAYDPITIPWRETVDIRENFTAELGRAVCGEAAPEYARPKIYIDWEHAKWVLGCDAPLEVDPSAEMYPHVPICLEPGKVPEPIGDGWQCRKPVLLQLGLAL